MKYPLGRLVITATCSPGLPILVRSSVRPAAAPESTWMAASRSGAPPAPVGAGSGSAFGGGGGGGGAGLGGAVVSAAAAAAGAGAGLGGAVASAGGTGRVASL